MRKYENLSDYELGLEVGRRETLRNKGLDEGLSKAQKEVVNKDKETVNGIVGNIEIEGRSGWMCYDISSSYIYLCPRGSDVSGLFSLEFSKMGNYHVVYGAGIKTGTEVNVPKLIELVKSIPLVVQALKDNEIGDKLDSLLY